MKISVNLLPSAEKEQGRIALRLWFVVRLAAVVISIIIISVGVVYALLAASTIEYDSVRAGTAAAALRRSDAAVHRINSATSFVLKTQKMQWSPSHIIAALAERMPPTVQWRSVEMDGHYVTVRGVAQTRDTALQMKADVEKSPCFREVQLPLSSLVQRTDTEFTLTATITECL